MTRASVDPLQLAHGSPAPGIAGQDFGGFGVIAVLPQEPMVTYFFPDNPHRFLSFSPTITANWKASGSERWTVPLSLGIGELVKFGSQSVNFQATAFYNAIKPSDAPTWTVELQVQFLFSK